MSKADRRAGKSLQGIVVLAAAAFLCFLPPGVAFAAPNAASAGKMLGYVVTWFYRANFDATDPANCPKNFGQPFKSKVLQSKGLSAAEIERLMKPENATERANSVWRRGPHGENVCLAPWKFADPGMPTGQSKINVGLDLNAGKDAPQPCGEHVQRTAPWGETGVDNEYGRVFACNLGWNEEGSGARENAADMANGEYSVLIEITGVDDEMNDDDVTVAIYNGESAALRSSAGVILPYVSHVVLADPLYANVWKAQIKDGVLTTKTAIDVHVRNVYLHGMPHSAIFATDGRLRLTLKKDGTVEGYLGGYLDLAEALQDVAGDSDFGRSMCDAMYHAMVKAADGYPDPKTGRCTRISSAWHIKAIPAFVIHPKDPHSAGPWQGNSSVVLVRAADPAVAKDERLKNDIAAVKKTRAFYRFTDVDDLTSRWRLTAEIGGKTFVHDCEIQQDVDKITAACGPVDGKRAAAPVRKEGDRLSWEYRSAGQSVRVTAKLVSSMTMQGVVRVGDGEGGFVLRRQIYGKWLTGVAQEVGGQIMPYGPELWPTTTAPAPPGRVASQ